MQMSYVGFFTIIECRYISERPHNPMINSGAITVTSLLKHEDKLSERYDWVSKNISMDPQQLM